MTPTRDDYVCPMLAGETPVEGKLYHWRVFVAAEDCEGCKLEGICAAQVGVKRITGGSER